MMAGSVSKTQMDREPRHPKLLLWERGILMPEETPADMAIQVV